MNTLSLRYQINLRILLSITILLVLGGSTAIMQARRSVAEEVQSSISLALQLIELGLSHAPQAPDQHHDWLPKITSLKATRHLSIAMQSASGRALYFNGRSGQQKTAAAPPQWFVNAVAAEYPQARYQLTAADGRPIDIVIQANPLDEITEAWEETRAFFTAIAAMVLVIFLAVNLVFNKALKSVAIILESLKAIEGGDYRRKLPLFSALEFSAIARAINHMTAVLEQARQENSALAQHSLEIQEEERQRLAQELHDEFGQSLAAVKVMAVTAKKTGADQEKISTAIASICDHLFGVVRSMMRTLHPTTLTELGLRAALEDLAEQWHMRNPDMQLSLHCGTGIDNLEGKKAIHLFRIIQECLTNVVRHAQARHVSVNLNMAEDPLAANAAMIFLKVEDDGKGCDLLSIVNGFGLQGMRERVAGLGGTLTLQSKPQQGMRVEARIPCMEAHQ